MATACADCGASLEDAPRECPACGALQVTAFAAPESELDDEDEALGFDNTSAPLPAGPRLAGAMLLVAAAVSALGLATGATAGVLVGSLVVDVIVGIALLNGSHSARGWAIVRAVLGGIYMLVTEVAAQQFIAAGTTVVFFAALMLLLNTRQRGGAFWAGAVLCSLVLLAGVVGQVSLFVRGAEMAPKGRYEHDGLAFQIPSEHWLRQPADLTRQQNADAALWLVHAIHDNHVIVVPEVLPAGVAFEQALGAVYAQAQSLPGYAELDPIPAPGAEVTLHYRADVNGLRLESFKAVFAEPPHVAQVTGWALQGNLKTETQALVRSFENLRAHQR